MDELTFGIYVHIPFCLSKCSYCSFVSKPGCEEEIEKYINFLCEEIRGKCKLFKNKVCKTIYFGGGTPSLINEKLIQKVLKTIKNNYNLVNNVEISLECNPCTINYNKLLNYKKFGINRLSFGVQSFNDNELKILSRRHNSTTAKNAIQMAKEIGFNNISADVMIGIPGQTKHSLQLSVQQLIDLNVCHISAYMLMLEEGTKLFAQVKSGDVCVASDDESVDMYDMVYNMLIKNGFKRYEISNFAKTGFECKHNKIYWQLDEYVGFGVSAHSYYNGIRYANSDVFEEYYKGLSTSEILTTKDKIEELIMLGLRQECGVAISSLLNLGYDILNERKNEIEKLLKNNLICIEDGHIKITQNNFGLTSAIILQLI